MDYIRQMDRPNIIQAGEVVRFRERGWGTIVEVYPILPGVVSQNFGGNRPVARVRVLTNDGFEVSGTDCDIVGWLVPGSGAMTIHDARICLPND